MLDPRILPDLWERTNRCISQEGCEATSNLPQSHIISHSEKKSQILSQRRIYTGHKCQNLRQTLEDLGLEYTLRVKENSSVCFRLNTGHDILAKHLHLLGIMQTPTCVLCNQNEYMERQHLNRCPILHTSSEENRYWKARTKMSFL